MNSIMLISDAAKAVNVENHVLRYWEEELHLPIKRNELGHRYYTQEDVERFKQIKSMKERGLQLKAIKMILKNGKLDVISRAGGDDGQWNEEKMLMEEEVLREQLAQQDKPEQEALDEESRLAIDIVEKHVEQRGVVPDNQEDKTRRLQWLLQQLFRETLQENNQQLCREIKESVIKELDYQFRIQEERDEERENRQVQRSEEYYKKMDELLRKKSKRTKLF